MKQAEDDAHRKSKTKKTFVPGDALNGAGAPKPTGGLTEAKRKEILVRLLVPASLCSLLLLRNTDN